MISDSRSVLCFWVLITFSPYTGTPCFLDHCIQLHPYLLRAQLHGGVQLEIKMSLSCIKGLGGLRKLFML